MRRMQSPHTVRLRLEFRCDCNRMAAIVIAFHNHGYIPASVLASACPHSFTTFYTFQAAGGGQG